GVGISIGLTRLLSLLVSRRGLTASRCTPAAVLVALTSEDARATSLGIATLLRSRDIPCEVAPAADRFGKQIRYADRRGIPYVWFPGRNGEQDQVKDIRSGEQHEADAETWRPRAAPGAGAAGLAVHGRSGPLDRSHQRVPTAVRCSPAQAPRSRHRRGWGV